MAAALAIPIPLRGALIAGDDVRSDVLVWAWADGSLLRWAVTARGGTSPAAEGREHHGGPVTTEQLTACVERLVRSWMPPDTSGLAPRQARALRFIDRYLIHHGYGPTTREVADAVGYRSAADGHRILCELQAAGKVVWQRNRARTLRLIRPP